MNLLELYARLHLQASIIQFMIVGAMLLLNYTLGTGFALVALIFVLLYFFTVIYSLHMSKKDVEIDQIPPNERTDAQKRLQFVKIAIDWFLMLLSMLVVLLTSIALVLKYVSTSI